MAIISSLIFAALVLLPRKTIGHQQTPSYSTGFANIGDASIGLRIRRRHQQDHSIHNHNARPSNNVVRNSFGRSCQLLHASFQQDDHHYSKRSGIRNATPKIHARINAAVSTIQQMIVKILTKMNQYFRIALLASSTLALVFSLPMSSSASSRNLLHSSSLDTPSSSYYLQNKPQNNPRPPQKQSTISITTNGNSDYKFIKKRNNGYKGVKEKQTVKRISLLVLATTIAASTFRASLRKSRIIRTASPFGRIRNSSPLGNGVSVIRVCMALGFDEDDGGIGGADSLLKKLQLEEKELYTKIAVSTQNQVQGSDAFSNFRQKALGEYLSNVASTFFYHQKVMRYGSIDSIRVPFVEDAVKEFRRSAKEERVIFNKQTQKQQQLMKETAPYQWGDVKQLPKTYVLATILLAIKGDHTSVPLPFGIIRQRDMARALSRIATDAKVDDSSCLVGSELLLIPNTVSGEEEILKSFPDLVPLT
eukprot:CAMPEP_0201994770 /NCGR_PEP_ID=MMETSP0905-20130828/2494_1 /ASSEMBLY_ACC=CAM_ASM_000554 /TAXON_ID=420261 /ORGANISM="Thalassiosira antarctica, Strain CCMP982" /LENGTH=476 /DNA_ID=CAMNT_0048549801 /DNA_START=17 /DNA_END=1447 /DNA_ORIENTATION=-